MDASTSLDLFAAARPCDDYLRRHRLDLRSFAEGESLRWFCWHSAACGRDLMTPAHAAHLATAGRAAWGVTPLDAISACARLRNLPAPAAEE